MAPTFTPVVVDNASKDGFPEKALWHTQVIVNAQNQGFAAAVNQGVRASSADILLLLNPDVRLLTGLDHLIDATRQYGLAGGKLVDASGKAQTGFTVRRFPTPSALALELFGLNRLWPGNPVNRRYRYLDRDLGQTGPVDQPAGAFLMFRRDVWEKLGGLDESFHPVWFEDVDFCRRAVDAGYRIQYVPSVIAEHSGGHSVSQLEEADRYVFWCGSLIRYAAKHFRPLAYRGICLAVVLSSIPRVVSRMILSGKVTPTVNSCCTMIRSAGRLLVSAQGVSPEPGDHT